MRKAKYIGAAIVLMAAAIAIFFTLKSEKVLVFQPKGTIAQQELNLIITNSILMLIVILPTFIVLLIVAWKYRENNPKETRHDNDQKGVVLRQAFFWIIPSVIVVVMAGITWDKTHKLDPFKPLDSEEDPFEIQVVALDWKWLFLYPEQGIATVNFVQFPERTPVHFSLSADGSPMNSFWIPQMSGQIYTMTGMVTSLYIMADGPGEYSGKAVEINGKGYATMTFTAKSSNKSEFNEWVAQVKQSQFKLTESAYNELLKPSENNPITYYSSYEDGLFEKIVMKYLHPSKK